MMNEDSSASSLSGLHGPEYTDLNQPATTRDDKISGRWVAVDESGWDGEQHHNRNDRYLVLGSVAVDDVSAAPIVEKVRRDAGLRQPPELKFKQFRKPHRLSVIKDLLGPEGDLVDRIDVYVVDKHYFVTAKLIDLLVVERAHREGNNLYQDGRARHLARTLFNDGPRALGVERFDLLIRMMVDFGTRRNHDGLTVSVEDLIAGFDKAWSRAHRRNVAEILLDLRGTKPEAMEVLASLQDNARMPTMEALIPSVTHVLRSWSQMFGHVNALLDEHRFFTDARIRKLLDGSTIHPGPYGEFVRRHNMPAARRIVRGRSVDHPSIQLADLVAGAALEALRSRAQTPSERGRQLVSTIIPLINEGSLLPYDNLKDLRQALET